MSVWGDMIDEGKERIAQLVPIEKAARRAIPKLEKAERLLRRAWTDSSEGDVGDGLEVADAAVLIKQAIHELQRSLPAEPLPKGGS